MGRIIKINSETIKKLYEYIIEKCMEWIVYLYNSLTVQEKWTSNLSEHYHIYKEYIGNEFVKTFLDERENILKRNRYRMKIEVLCEKAEPDVVGKVILCRKEKAIHQATLKVRHSNGNEGIIFWSFNEEKNNNQ